MAQLIRNYIYDRALELDRRGAVLARQAADEYMSGAIAAHPLAQDLHDCANSMRREALLLAGRWKRKRPCLESLEVNTIEPIVDRFLNRIYRDISMDTPFNVTLLVQDLGGFGDLIFGVRALKALQEGFPHMRLLMLTNGANKLKKVFSAIQHLVVEFKSLDGSCPKEARWLLEDSDLIIASPTLPGSLVPSNTKKRAITVIEYNRPDYGLDVRKGQPMSGIGRNTLGIFIDNEMRVFAKENLFPLKPETKIQLLGQLEDKKLHELIQALGVTNRLYFGYGNQCMDRFLEVLIRYEARLDERDAVILAISNSCYKKFLKEKFKGQLPSGIQRIVIHRFANDMGILKAMQSQGIILDPDTVARARERIAKDMIESSRFEKEYYQKKLDELDEMVEKAKTNPLAKPRSEFQQSLVDGLFFTEHGVIESSVLTENTLPGKTLHINDLGALSFHDSRLVKKASEDICLSTGDQSLTEDISLGKALMYDLRKREPIEALWDLAKQNQLHLASEFFRSFVDNKIDAVVECLLKQTQLRKEIQALYSIIYKEMDLTPELISLVKRKLSKGKIDQEDHIHKLFKTYFLSPRVQELFSILMIADEMQRTLVK